MAVNMDTGVAEGHVCIKRVAGGVASKMRPGPCRETTRPTNGENGAPHPERLSLVITLDPDWTAKINRPVLSLRSTPALVRYCSDEGDTRAGLVHVLSSRMGVYPRLSRGSCMLWAPNQIAMESCAYPCSIRM